jgi:hypothetical protein
MYRCDVQPRPTSARRLDGANGLPAPSVQPPNLVQPCRPHEGAQGRAGAYTRVHARSYVVLRWEVGQNKDWRGFQPSNLSSNLLREVGHAAH